MAIQSFGTPPAESPPLKPEPHYGTCTHDDLAEILAGYRALDAASGGAYGKFLRSTDGCNGCDGIPEGNRPLSFLQGGFDFRKSIAELTWDLQRAAEALAPYRRGANEGRLKGTVRYFPGDPAARPALATFLRKHDLQGLFIGHCGWSDFAMRLRGETASLGVKLMILGNDWYPLTQCKNFLTDRFAFDLVVKNFIRNVSEEEGRKVQKLEEDDVRRFFRQHDAYLGNTLLCFRNGWGKEGPSNLSWQSFENCREKVKAHIHALRPRVVATFGANSSATVAGISTGADQRIEEALAKIRLVGRSAAPLGASVTSHYDRVSRPAGLPVRCDEIEFVFVPLCHPSRRINRFRGDYAALLRALGSA